MKIEHLLQKNEHLTFPAWVSTYEENTEDENLPYALVLSSFLLAFLGLFIVLFGINCYHRYVGYNQVQRNAELGVENIER